MKKYIFLFLFITIKSVYAQDSNIIYSDFIIAKSIINPSFIGKEGGATFFLSSAVKKLGGTGIVSEESYSALFTTPISSKLSLGVIATSHDVGITSTQKYGLGFSYFVKLGPSSQLRFGLRGAYNHLVNDYEKLTREPDVFLSGQEKIDYIDFSLGTSLYLKNTLVSFSTSNLFSSYLKDITDTKFSDRNFNSSILVMQKIKLSDDFELYPSVYSFARETFELDSYSVYFNTAVSYKKKISLFGSILAIRGGIKDFTAPVSPSFSAGMNITFKRSLILSYAYKNASLKNNYGSFYNEHSLGLKYTLAKSNSYNVIF